MGPLKGSSSIFNVIKKNLYFYSSYFVVRITNCCKKLWIWCVKWPQLAAEKQAAMTAKIVFMGISHHPLKVLVFATG